MTVTEFKKAYAECDGILLGWNDGDVVIFSYFPVADMTASTWKALGEGSFRKLRTNERILRARGLDVTSMAKIDACEGENRGYKAESYLFGAPNYTDSKVDGVWNGKKVQLKTSFTSGNGTSRSNKF